MATSSFDYVTYIRTTPSELWRALTEPDFTRRYWAQTWQESAWEKGAPWRLMIPDGRIGDSGEVLEIDAPRKLVLSWRVDFNPELRDEGHSRVTYELEGQGDMVRLSFRQEIDRPGSKLVEQMSQGWPLLFASLKSLLETGEPLSATRSWPEDH